MTQSAIRFARGVHAAQRRGSDEAPFILHPLEVAAMLYNSGAGDDVIAAGVLHDVVEDTTTAIAEVREQFGGHIAALVMSLTEDPMIKSARDRKADLRAQVRRSGNEVGLIFAADKVAKARELRSLVAHDHLADGPRSKEIIDKLEHYVASLWMLEELIPDHPLVRQLRFELEALDSYPPEGMSALAQSTLADGMGGQTRVRADTAA